MSTKCLTGTNTETIQVQEPQPDRQVLFKHVGLYAGDVFFD